MELFLSTLLPNYFKLKTFPAIRFGSFELLYRIKLIPLNVGGTVTCKVDLSFHKTLTPIFGITASMYIEESLRTEIPPELQSNVVMSILLICQAIVGQTITSHC